ncbi:MAG: glycosyltransferase [Vulcanimicrobiaceae bacterium]
MSVAYDVVVPTIGRPSLRVLLAALDRAAGPPPQRVILVDDRRAARAQLDVGELPVLGSRIEIVAGRGAGPAAARNRGWRAATAPWVAFLDDDVVVDARWCADLAADIARCGETCAGTQADLRVPLPAHRAPTDWERNVAALEGARWITADFAFRRAALAAVNGFDERFPRAFREDADLALRLIERGWQLGTGTRRTDHPVRPADAWVSVRLQAGNADDVLMDALHGRDWHARATSPRGAFGSHLITVGLATAALLSAVGWLAATLRFAWERIARGPRDAREVVTMLVTSAVIPFAAVYHRARGVTIVRALRRDRPLRDDRVANAATPNDTV